MGLDMWITRKSDGEEIIYWRKANQIRGWFADMPTFRDNGITVITKADLKSLYLDIESVLKEPLCADEILPTTSGFIFGSLEYDEYYFDTLKRTKETLKAVIDSDSDDEVYEYMEWY